VKSGEKSLRRYSLEESHQYFRQAFGLMGDSPRKTLEEKRILIDILIKWAHVYDQRGDFTGLIDLYEAHEDLALSLDDAARLGMFYSWLGLALRLREKPKDAYQYLCRALELGEKSEDNRVIGYSCAWLAMTCADLGFLDKAIVFGERAKEISRLVKSDSELFLYSMLAMGLAYYVRGETRKTDEIGRVLLDFGQRQSHIRCTAFGHGYVACGYLLAGNFPSAIESFQRQIEISVDPNTLFNGKLFLGLSYFSDGQLQKAEDTFEEVRKFSESFGSELWGLPAQGFKAIVSIAKGNLSEGVRIVEGLLRLCLQNESRYYYATGNYLMGQIYLQMVQRVGPKSFSLLARNIGFLIKNVPVANKKAEAHFSKAIEVAKEAGEKGVMGQSYLGLGLLYATKGRKDEARRCISKAFHLFEQCEAEVYLKQAKEALEELG
jgi:tetratricopeptide (TPR) repeat protein